MTYIPGHSVWVGYAAESALVSDSVTESNGTTAAAISAAPTGITYLGYLDVPEATDEYGAKMGYSVGSPYAQYAARGSNNPSISLRLRVGQLAFLSNYCVRTGGGDYGLAPVCLYVGVAGEYTDIYRYCYVDSCNITLQEGNAQEVTVDVTLQAMTRQLTQNASYVKNPSINDLTQGAALMFHDVRSFVVPDVEGTDLDYRQMLQGCTISVAHNLERKGIRPFWGDDQPLSLTSYAIMPHLVTVSGELTLHDRLPENYFTSLARSRDWGNIEIGITDGVKTFDLRIVQPRPVSRTFRGVEASAQLSYSVPYVAQNLIINPV